MSRTLGLTAVLVCTANTSRHEIRIRPTQHKDHTSRCPALSFDLCVVSALFWPRAI